MTSKTSNSQQVAYGSLTSVENFLTVSPFVIDVNTHAPLCTMLRLSPCFTSFISMLRFLLSHPLISMVKGDSSFWGYSPWIYGTHYDFYLLILSFFIILLIFSLDVSFFFFYCSTKYMLFGILVAVPINIYESSSLISHFWGSNKRFYPWSHNLPTLRRFFFKSLTSKTFCAFIYSLPRLVTLFQVSWQNSYPKMQRCHSFLLSWEICFDF